MSVPGSVFGRLYRLPHLVVSVCLSFLATTILLATVPLPGAAQIVQGTIVDRETGTPVEGALVVLLAEGGEVDGFLTDAAGRFRLTAGGPGRFTVRAERTGLESVTSDPVGLAGEQTVDLTLETEPIPIPLSEQRVEGEQRCVVRPEEGVEPARVWEEARKSLRVQDWTLRGNLFEYMVSRYERVMDARSHLVLSENHQRSTNLAPVPFRSLPAEDLIEGGFIRELEEGGFRYYGPDASVLLSDSFLDTHCFRLASSEDSSSSIGLAFEPISDQGTPDITGTIWMDRLTGGVERLDYQYTWAPYPEGVGEGRGMIEFAGLPTGARIVRKWWIRMPNVSPDPNPAGKGLTEYRLSTLTEVGGEVVQAVSPDETFLIEAERGSLTGVVWDSILGGPVPGATVFFSGTSFEATTDPHGQFRMEDIPEGLFQVAFSHPRLGALGIFSPTAEVEVTREAAARVELGIPSAGTVLGTRCGGLAEGERAVSGTVRLWGTEEALPGVRVEAAWPGTSRQGDPVEEYVRTVSDGDGGYLLCGLPPEQGFVLRTSLLEYVGGWVEMGPHAPSAVGVDLTLDFPPGMVTFRTTSEGIEWQAGKQGIQGRVLEPETQHPVRNAEVTLRQVAGEMVGTAVTNDRGFFRIVTPTPGTFTLRATALGYADGESTGMEVAEGMLTVLEILLPPAPLELEPIVVEVESRSFHLEANGFYDRAQQGVGTFITAEEIEAQHAIDLTDILQPVPGVQAVRNGFGTAFLILKPMGPNDPNAHGPPVTRGRVTFDGYCEPLLVIDGFPVQTDRPARGDGDVGVYPDQFVNVSDVAGIEVHRRASSIPMQYGGAMGSCGVIMIWTKGG